jgi:hypothetical protein
LDEAALPGVFPTDVTVVCGINGRFAHPAWAEYIYSLMGPGAGIGAARVGIEQAELIVDGEELAALPVMLMSPIWGCK